MVISFSHPLARAQLLEKGRVCTFRKNRRKKVGNDWANEGRLKPKMCDVHIEEVGSYKPSELGYWVPYSGFSSLVEWIDAIFEITGIFGSVVKGDMLGWLYEVTLKRSNGSETQ